MEETIPAVEQTPFHDAASAAGATFAEEHGWLLPAKFIDWVTEHHRTHHSAGLFDLSHHGKIQLSGPEAVSFLHNLCTNDVKNLAAGTGCEAFLTNAKARIIAHVFIDHVERPEGNVLWLDAGPFLGEKVFKHLDRHLISEQVELADRTRDFAQLHLAGSKAKDMLDKALGEPLPELAPLKHVFRKFADGEPSQVRRHDPLGLPGFDIVCPAAQAASVWQKLTDAGAQPAGREAYHLLRIEGGTPIYGIDMDEERFVVEVNRIPQAICYTKGCYLGQEPIVMARDRGHVNRKLVGLKVAGAMPIAAGSKVWRNGLEVGQVTSAAFSPDLGSLGLAYVRRGNDEPGTTLEIQELPPPEGSGVAVMLPARAAVVAPLPFPREA
ncbi:MAG: aminomethyltransferase family protein [Gemmataceae bacterium]|nr:aminomethyltransferase family protein [Gemmataceae bacterium]